MLAARRLSWPCASLRSASAFEISEYSTTPYAPSRTATTPTDSTGSVLRTTLAAHSASWETQYPMKVGSATRTRQLSTQYAWRYLIWCEARSSRTEIPEDSCGWASAA